MIQVGCKYEKSKISYYTDNHEREDVVLQRYAYIKKRKELSFLRTRCHSQLGPKVHIDPPISPQDPQNQVNEIAVVPARTSNMVFELINCIARTKRFGGN